MSGFVFSSNFGHLPKLTSKLLGPLSLDLSFLLRPCSSHSHFLHNSLGLGFKLERLEFSISPDESEITLKLDNVLVEDFSFYLYSLDPPPSLADSNDDPETVHRVEHVAAIAIGSQWSHVSPSYRESFGRAKEAFPESIKGSQMWHERPEVEEISPATILAQLCQCEGDARD